MVSFVLASWYQKTAPNSYDAALTYDQLTEGLIGSVEDSSAVDGFRRAVLSEFPQLSEENMHESPWTASLYATRECAIASFSWSRADDVSSFLLDLASQYGLTAYDPQEQVVHRPTAVEDRVPPT